MLQQIITCGTTLSTIYSNIYTAIYTNVPNLDTTVQGYIDDANDELIDGIMEIENMIMLHYCAGSIYDTPFWEFAKKRGENRIKKGLNNKWFNKVIDYTKNNAWSKVIAQEDLPVEITFNSSQGTWIPSSYKQNLKGLDLYDKLERLKNEQT